MKILFLTDDYPPDNWGGAGKIVYNLACHFAERGYDVSVVAATQDRKKIGKTAENKATIYRLYSNYNGRWRAYFSLYNPQVISSLKKIMEEIRPDIVHAHNIHAHLSYASLALAKFFAKRVFLTFHDAMSIAYGKVWPETPECGNPRYVVSWLKNLKTARLRFNPFRSFLISYCLKKTDAFFLVSDALKEILSGRFKTSRMVTVHNGLGAAKAVKMSDEELIEFKKKYNLLGKKVMLLAGRFSYAKGSYGIIDILDAINKAADGVVFFLAGVPEGQFKIILDYAESRGVKNLVRIAGWLGEKEMALAYASSDIVLTPSLYLDPFPTVNLEAALYKKPVVATCFGGSKEFVLDGETGYIVNPYVHDALRQKISELLKDNSRLKKFGEAAYERLKNDFSLDAQAEKLLYYYSGENSIH